MTGTYMDSASRLKPAMTATKTILSNMSHRKCASNPVRSVVGIRLQCISGGIVSFEKQRAID